MANARDLEVWRSEDGREWRIGGNAEVAWIEGSTPGGLRITSAIPPVFEVYATLELPGTGHHEGEMPPLEEEWKRHEEGVLSVLEAHSQPQSWWLGYLDSGATDLIFDGARRVRHPDLKPRVREVDLMVEDATPPGHTAY